MAKMNYGSKDHSVHTTPHYESLGNPGLKNAKHVAKGNTSGASVQWNGIRDGRPENKDLKQSNKG